MTPYGLAQGPGSSLYVTEDSAANISPTSSVARFDESDGAFLEQTVGDVASLFQLVLGRDGKLWIALDYHAGRLLATIKPDLSGFTVLPANSAIGIYENPGEHVTSPLALGAGGNIYEPTLQSNVCNFASTTPSAQTTLSTLFTQDFPYAKECQTAAVAQGSDGNLWFTIIDAQLDASTLFSVTPAGVAKQYGLSGIDACSFYVNIVSATDGNLWFNQNCADSNPAHQTSALIRATTQGATTTYPLPKSVAASTGPMVADPFGALWLTTEDVSGNQFIARATLDGVVRQSYAVEVPVKLASSDSTYAASRSAVQSVVGADGAIYFLMQGSKGDGLIEKMTY